MCCSKDFFGVVRDSSASAGIELSLETCQRNLQPKTKFRFDREGGNKNI